MKCPKCDKKLRAKYVSFDYSEKSGIPGCILENIKQYTCKKCDETYHDLGSIDEINMMIGNILLGSSVLTRQQVKFIRSHIFKMSYFEFGKILKTNPQHLRDVENHRKILSKELIKIIQDELLKKTYRPTIIMES